MGKGSPAQPHFPRIFAFYDTSSAGSLQGGKNECRFAEVSKYDLENDDPEITYYHPAKVMGDIYGLIGSKYDKHESDVSSLVNCLEKEDYKNLIESSKCSTFTSFVQELLN